MVPLGLAPCHVSQAWQSVPASSWQTLLRAAIYQMLRHRAELHVHHPVYVQSLRNPNCSGQRQVFSDLMGQGPEGCCHQSPWSLLACAGLRGLPRAFRSPTTAWGTDVTAGPPATTACGTQGGDSTPGGLPSPATQHPQCIPKHPGWGWEAFHLS